MDEEEEEDVVEAPRKYPRSKAQVSNPFIDICMCVHDIFRHVYPHSHLIPHSV